MTPLIEADELLRLAAAPDLRILDCRHELSKPLWGAAAYAQGHIPGAVFASLDRDLSGPHPAGHRPASAALARGFRGDAGSLGHRRGHPRDRL